MQLIYKRITYIELLSKIMVTRDHNLEYFLKYLYHVRSVISRYVRERLVSQKILSIEGHNSFYCMIWNVRTTKK